MDLLSNILHCCNRPASTELKVVDASGDAFSYGSDAACCIRPGPEDEYKIVHLSSDIMEGGRSPDPFDLAAGAASWRPHDPECDRSASKGGLTAHQKDLKERVWLPAMTRPNAADDSAGEAEEKARVESLLKIFQAFVLDMHAGISMTQIDSLDDYADMHLQLLDDLMTLAVDQGSGCITEFPLTAVTRIYRIVRCIEGQRHHSVEGIADAIRDEDAEHIVVIEFMRRKLVIVFDSVRDAQSFIMSMELLVRFAQEASARRKAEKLANLDTSGGWWGSSQSGQATSADGGLFVKTGRGAPPVADL